MSGPERPEERTERPSRRAASSRKAPEGHAEAPKRSERGPASPRKRRCEISGQRSRSVPLSRPSAFSRAPAAESGAWFSPPRSGGGQVYTEAVYTAASPPLVDEIPYDADQVYDLDHPKRCCEGFATFNYHCKSTSQHSFGLRNIHFLQ